MHQNDLSIYECVPGVRVKDSLAVGWLDESHPFPTGPIALEFVSLLHSLYCGERQPDVKITTNQVRGFVLCQVCRRQAFVRCNGRLSGLGSYDLIIPSGDFIYVSPNLILHYIDEHNYKPPDVYIQAVLAMADCQSFDADEVFNTRPIIK